MNKILITGLLFFITTTDSFAGFQPYIAGSVNFFIVKGSDITATNLTTGATSTLTEDTSDSGTTAGIAIGAFVSDNIKVNLSYFSGTENDSSIITATVSTISVDYLFNNSGVHRGWFLGGGYSKVEIEIDEIKMLTNSGTADDSGLMARAGYEYKFDNKVLLEVGINFHFAKIEQLLEGSSSNINLKTNFEVSNINLLLGYAF
ncbi:MAG: hypothetical protein ACC657_08865 [Thiohalomonadales bacterium]